MIVVEERRNRGLTLRASAALAKRSSRCFSLVRRFLRRVSGTACCCGEEIKRPGGKQVSIVISIWAKMSQSTSATLIRVMFR